MGQANGALAVDDLPAGGLTGKCGAQQGIDRLTRVRAVTQLAIGDPGQVQAHDQREVVVALVAERERVERFVPEQQVTVDGDHQGRGVGDDEIDAVVGPREHATGLLPCNGRLLVGPGRAALPIAPLAQHFVHHGHLLSAGAQGRGEGRGQHGLAGALGAEQGDALRTFFAPRHGASTSRSLCRQARQPAQLRPMNRA